MMRFLTVLFAIFTFGHTTLAQTAGKVDFGDLQTGSTVFFSQSINGEWGMEIVNDATVEFAHPQPIFFEIQKESNKVQTFRLGYRDVQKQGDSLLASALLPYGNVVFKINDVWTIVESALSLKRTLQVEGSDPKIGFSSGVRLSTPNTIKWSDVFFFVPGLFYADLHAVDNEDQKPLGFLQYREDVMPTPCLGLFYPNGVWVSLIHKNLLSNPNFFFRGDLNVSSTINESFEYGLMAASEHKLGGIELGYSLPGSLQTNDKNSKQISMFHPARNGFQQKYTVDFQFGKHEFYRDMIQCLEQRIWENLTPNFSEQTLSATRTVLADQLLSLVTKAGEISGLPMSANAVNGKISAHLASANTIEAAALLIYEAELDQTDRRRAFRRQGLNLIDSKIKLLSMNPPLGETFDVRNGQVQSFGQPGAYCVHHLSLEMNALMDLIQYEMTKGRQHIPWLEWVRGYGDWLLANQQLGGSFPLSMKNGTNETLVEAGDLSYASIPFLVSLTEVTGNRKYLAAALNAALFVWGIQGGQFCYIGYDQGKIRVDKASGMYAMEAFLCLYENTKNKIWLDRALSAAYYTISWIQTWNAPVSSDFSGNTVKWGPDFSTIGMQSVYQDGYGLRDQSLTYAIPGFVKLYQLTGDTILLKVVNLLAKSTNTMMESNEQKIGLKAPGWKIDRWHVGFLKPTSANPDAWRTETTVQPLRGLTKLQLQHSDLLKMLNKNSVQ